jgi:hypothetical protein
MERRDSILKWIPVYREIPSFRFQIPSTEKLIPSRDITARFSALEPGTWNLKL